eukprot:gene21226-1182_t
MLSVRSCLVLIFLVAAYSLLRSYLILPTQRNTRLRQTRLSRQQNSLPSVLDTTLQNTVSTEGNGNTVLSPTSAPFNTVPTRASTASAQKPSIESETLPPVVQRLLDEASVGAPPSKDFRKGLPIGNGDLCALVIANENGVQALVSKSDAIDENHNLLKVGTIKWHLSPSQVVRSITHFPHNASVVVHAKHGCWVVWIDSSIIEQHHLQNGMQ